MIISMDAFTATIVERALRMEMARFAVDMSHEQDEPDNRRLFALRIASNVLFEVANKIRDKLEEGE